MSVCLLDKICYMYEGTPKPQYVTIQVKCCSCCSFLHITALFRATIIKKQMQLFSVLIGTRYELKNLLFVSIALRGAYLLKQYLLALWFGAVVWRCGVVVITTAQLHSTKPELRFCAGSNPARSVLDIHDGEDLCQWSGWK